MLGEQRDADAGAEVDGLVVDVQRALEVLQDGQCRLAGRARVDTRNDVNRPWAGWYVAADYELGDGRVTAFAPLSSDGTARARDRALGRRTYGRAFVDLRRYNRLTPDAQLNFRLAAGGWVHGDPLPAQRRLSVGGPGARRLPRRPAPHLPKGHPAHLRAGYSPVLRREAEGRAGDAAAQGPREAVRGRLAALNETASKH